MCVYVHTYIPVHICVGAHVRVVALAYVCTYGGQRLKSGVNLPPFFICSYYVYFVCISVLPTCM